MDYSKAYLIIFIFAAVFAVFIISQVKQLETTWTGIHSPAETVANPYNNEYSPVFFTKRKCESWVKERKRFDPQGFYSCGKNCEFQEINLLSCEKIYQY